MVQVLRGVLGLIGALALLVAAKFWIDPLAIGHQLGVTHVVEMGALGSASMRADFAGFFAAGGIFSLYAVIKGRAQWLMVPSILLGLALTGRLLSFAIDGGGQAEIGPMLVEAVGVALSITGLRTLPRG